MEGMDIMTVKELMGHKTLDMTLHYSHVAPNHEMKAVRFHGLNNLFWFYLNLSSSNHGFLLKSDMDSNKYLQP